MGTKYLKINPADNVVVAISDLKAGETITVDGNTITLQEDVPAGHKVTLKDFAEGENIIKYGYPIGHAMTAVKQGSWISEKQIKTNLAGLLEYTYNPERLDLQGLPPQERRCGYPQRSMDYPHRGLCKRHHQPTGGSPAPRNQQRRSRCHHGISAQLWLLPTGR